MKKAVRVRIPISATGLLRNNKTRGFTLIELLVVILILGLFSSLLAVRIEDVVTGGDLRLASRIVIAQIQKLRGMAGLTHKVQVLGVQVGKGKLYPVQLEQEKDFAFEENIKEKDRPSAAVNLPDGVVFKDVVIVSKQKVQDGEARIKFYPNGCVDRAMIHIENQHDKVYTLEILPLTGQVIIHDGYIEHEMEK